MELSFLDKAPISEEIFQQVTSGDEIIYLLAPQQLPTNPLRQWHGRVLSLDDAGGNVLVVILDAGYHEETECVNRHEIISVYKASERERY